MTPLVPEQTKATARALLSSVPWRVVIAGWLVAYGVGLLVGLGLELLGWWTHGAGWERASLVLAQRTVRPWLDPFFLWVPLVGTNYSLVPIVAVAAVVLWRREYYTVALHIVTVQLGSWMLNPALKFTIPRPRPDLFELRGQYAFPAYPSGHSVAVVSVLVTAAYLVDRAGLGRWAYWAVGIFFVINSYSRLYLAVHWPTDVIGGAVVGAIWLAVTLRAFGPLHDEAAVAERRRLRSEASAGD